MFPVCTMNIFFFCVMTCNAWSCGEHVTNQVGNCTAHLNETRSRETCWKTSLAWKRPRPAEYYPQRCGRKNNELCDSLEKHEATQKLNTFDKQITTWPDVITYDPPVYVFLSSEGCRRWFFLKEMNWCATLCPRNPTAALLFISYRMFGYCPCLERRVIVELLPKPLPCLPVYWITPPLLRYLFSENDAVG